MRLERLFTHRLIRFLQFLLPVVVAGLIADTAWNYWVQNRVKPRAPNASKLPKELSIRTDNFNFSKTQGARTLFTIHAKTNLGFNDDKNMLQGVEITIYGTQPSDPVRHVNSDSCNYDHKTDDITCTGDVELRLDDKTTARTDTVVYNHAGRFISANTLTRLERTDAVTGQANSFEYTMDSGLLKLAGAVNLHGRDGVEMRAASAVFQEKENWTTASGNVSLKSKNGWLRGDRVRAELTPETYHPRNVLIEGNVSSESIAPGSGDKWTLRSAWMQASMSAKGTVEHVLARTGAELTKTASDGNLVMTGGEIESQMSESGQVDLVEARQTARMQFAGDRFLTADKIRTNTNGFVSTEGPSTLQAGDAHIVGNVFSIQNGDLVTFHTDKRATLTQQDRVTSADVTDAQIDSRTNQVVSMTQKGHFTFKQSDQSGKADLARIEDSGELLTLEGAARVSDGKTQIEAARIQINEKTKARTASGKVKSVTSDSGGQVLVTSDTVRQTEETVTYTGTNRDKVHLYRGGAFVEADKLEAPVESKVFRATATGRVFSTLNNIRVWADRLDYDEQTHLAHYIGGVNALKQDLKITSADMLVKTKEGAGENGVSEITGKGKVVVTRAEGRGTGELAVYKAATDQVVLTGTQPNAELIDGQGNRTTGPRITVNVAGDKMSVVEGSGSDRAVTTHRVTKP